MHDSATSGSGSWAEFYERLNDGSVTDGTHGLCSFMSNHDVFVVILKTFNERGDSNVVLHLAENIRNLMTEKSAFAAETFAQGKACIIGTLVPLSANTARMRWNMGSDSSHSFSVSSLTNVFLEGGAGSTEPYWLTFGMRRSASMGHPQGSPIKRIAPVSKSLRIKPISWPSEINWRMEARPSSL